MPKDHLTSKLTKQGGIRLNLKKGLRCFISIGKPRGFAFIEFEEEGDADSAIDNFDDAEIFGNFLSKIDID